MKRSLLFVVVALLAVVAPQSASTSPPGEVFHFEFVLQCPDEQVAVSDEELLVVERIGGQTTHITSLISGTGIGLDTGTTYKLQGTGTFTSASHAAGVFVSVQRVMLVPEDGGKALASGHTTIIVLNAKGEFTAFKESRSVRLRACAGLSG
jgi:hypothetical protein